MESALSDGAFDPELRLPEGALDPDLRLIETLLWNGQSFPRLALHMQRLEKSAARLGWPAPIGVGDALAGLTNAPLRVRLTMDRLGTLRVETAPLPAAKPSWRIGLAEARLHSADRWLTVKSTRRAVYDATRAALPADLDELIFLNEHGEVCDGTITSVFFDRGQGMRTPPLTCGLLPGVLRAELHTPEQVLLAADLGTVQLWVGNALRGLIPAQITEQSRP